MTQDQLGLYDTPAGRQEWRLGGIIVGLLFVSVLIVFPARHIRIGEISAFVPVIDATMIAAELTIAALLYAQAAVFRLQALKVLATGYLFVALLLAGHVLTFPGAFAPDGLLGAGPNTAAWLAAIRRVAFPTAIFLYALFKRADQPDQMAGTSRPMIGRAILLGFCLAVAATLFAIEGHEVLPALFVDRQQTNYLALLVLNCTTIAVTGAAMLMLFRRQISVLDLWLLIALSAWLAQSLLNLTLTARFTGGWYSLYVVMLASSLVVMVALIAESARLYAGLALAIAARKREKANRLMSMDALASAVSHEVGQPLSAVVTNAMAAQSWLNRAKPDHEMAIKAISGTIEAGQRTFDVIKSVRAMFAAGTPTTSEFDFNELVNETVSFMHRELAGAKIRLRLELATGLSPVRADRVQMQRVLINLLTNAMEAVNSRRAGSRHVTIRTIALEENQVQLDVADTGVGIEPDTLERIFEPLFTTKASGQGLGLSLCRAIVEEHGGHLWASRGEDVGAIIHLTLPTRRAAKEDRDSMQAPGPVPDTN